MGSGKSETRGSCQYQTLINRKNLSMPTVTQETYKPVRSELSHCRQETFLGISRRKLVDKFPGSGVLSGCWDRQDVDHNVAYNGRDSPGFGHINGSGLPRWWMFFVKINFHGRHDQCGQLTKSLTRWLAPNPSTYSAFCVRENRMESPLLYWTCYHQEKLWVKLKLQRGLSHVCTPRDSPTGPS